ncbi:MAG: AMP-dependent synthetase/ligase [Saprospiraceae bacterium]|nr:AMP-dependent synthetase/ligase [Saprospiraceae bacterium]
MWERLADGSYRPWSRDDVQECLWRLESFLINLKAAPGDLILLVPGGAKPGWVLLDLLAQQCGLGVVLGSAASGHLPLTHIAREAEPIAIVVDESIPKLDVETTVWNLRDLLDSSTVVREKNAVASPDPLSLSTIIYTSGTSGHPKGVMLTHENIMSNVRAITLLLPLSEHQKVLSFLPYSHVFERTLIYAYIARRGQVYFSSSVVHLAEDLQTVQPHFFTAVPRILERMHMQVVHHFSKQNLIIRRLFKWALRFSERYQPHGFRPIQRIQSFFIQRLLLAGFRRKMGGNLIAIMVGAAHLRPQIAAAFEASGIKIREGYGMSETSPVITVNRFQPGLHRLGTVGLPLPGIEVRVVSPNENGHGDIEVKGPNVMLGYFKKPVQTRESFTTDGFFKTGDVGKLDDRGFLQITDRSKDIFKTSAGRYISPAELENHFRDSHWIEDIFILGFQRPFVTALVLPDFSVLENWSHEQKLHWTSPQYMVHNIKVQDQLGAAIDELNSMLPKHKMVRNFHLIYQPFSLASGQLSYTLKPIRKKILEDYDKEINQLYL